MIFGYDIFVYESMNKHHRHFKWMQFFLFLRQNRALRTGQIEKIFVPFATFTLSFCRMISVTWYLEVKYLCMWVKKHHICFLYRERFFTLKKQYEINETTNKCTFVPFVTLIISFCEMISVKWYLEVRRLSRGVTKQHKHFRYIPLFFYLYSKIGYYDKKK